MMTTDEFLRFVAGIRRITRPDYNDMIDRFNLSERDLKRKIKHLSHGTVQKIGIIQAFFHHPDLLILDEPTGGLDPLMQEAFYDLLREFQQVGSTIFLSSHNLPEVEKLCHRVAVIREGELVALETLESLKQKRFRVLKIVLDHPVERIDIDGAELVKQAGMEYEFIVKGNVHDLVRDLNELPLKDFSFESPDLEQVFAAYYRSQSNG